MSSRLASYSMKGTVSISPPTQNPAPVSLIELPEPIASGPSSHPRAISTAAYRTGTEAFCRSYRFPVKLSTTGEVIELYGELATSRPLNQISSLQLLLAGGSNNGSYWDWPLDPEAHSYVRHATSQGFATLNLDRPGYGKSDRPDPMRTDFAVQGHAVNQVIEQLKASALGYRFDKVVLHGHSMGGMVAWHAASTSKIADAVIVSGVGHNLSDEAMKFVNANAIPVEEHPRYGPGVGWKQGYFARPISAQPPTTPVDWYTCMLQDTVMSAELAAIAPDSRNAAITMGIEVPVLFALGDKDLRWCTTTGDCRTDPAFVDEARYYRPGLDFTSFVVPDCGHLTNKDPGAHHFFERVTKWLRKRGF